MKSTIGSERIRHEPPPLLELHCTKQNGISWAKEVELEAVDSGGRFNGGAVLAGGRDNSCRMSMHNTTATPFQEQNLLSMMEIIKSSSKARVIARSLWHFFEHRLTCRRPDTDLNHANTCHIEIEQFLNSRRPGDLSPEVVIRRNARQEVGLVHELLHLNLIPLGFPKFRIWAEDDDDAAWQLAGGVINNADHTVMLPIFTSLGYPESDFLGPSGPHSEREVRVFEDIEKLKPSLTTPREYSQALSDYLSNRSIEHEVIWIADLIAW